MMTYWLREDAYPQVAVAKVLGRLEHEVVPLLIPQVILSHSRDGRPCVHSGTPVSCQPVIEYESPVLAGL